MDPAFKNGTDGVIFAIDEIQNEFSCANSKDFPETLLSQVTQQRKPINLSILDFKFFNNGVNWIVWFAINLSILDFKFG